MKKKQSEDESLVLKVNEWSRILSEDNIEIIKSIVRGAKQRRDSLRIDKNEKKRIVEEKAKRTSRLRLREIAEKFREDLIKKQTSSEAKFKIILKELNIKYEFQKIFYTETTFYIADFYLLDYNIVIEVDGGYHTTSEQRSKDNKRTAKLIEDIEGVYRIKNEAVDNIELAKGIVKGFLVKAKKQKLDKRVAKHYK